MRIRRFIICGAQRIAVARITGRASQECKKVGRERILRMLCDRYLE
jgi:hypothetical protein